jgi:hypothetical protein
MDEAHASPVKGKMAQLFDDSLLGILGFTV